MGKKTEDTPLTPEDKRFINAINKLKNKLKEENKPLSDTELSKEITSEGNIYLVNKIRKGKQSVQYENIELLCRKFSINKEYIKEGAGDVFIDTGDQPDRKPWISDLLDEKKDLPYILRLENKYREISDKYVQLLEEKDSKLDDRNRLLEEIIRLKDEISKLTGTGK